MSLKRRFNLIIVLLILTSLLLPGTAMAIGDHYGIQRNEYGWYSSEITEQGELSYMMNWLNAETRYKGWVWNVQNGDNNGVRFGYSYPTFDPDSTSYWAGDAYTSTGVYYERVYELQFALYYLGYNPLSNIDGYWGSTTKQAVQDFQYTHSMTPDGVVGSSTWTRLSYDN